MANPSWSDYLKDFVATGGIVLPEVSPEDRGQLSAKELWKQMYKDMAIFEKGTFNANQRKKESHSTTESAAKKKIRY